MAKNKKRIGQQKTVLFLVLGIAMIIGIIQTLPRNTITGYVVVTSGTTASLGSQTLGDPLYGAAKGTLDFTLTDNGNIISSTIGSNYTLYFSKAANITNTTLIKTSTTNETFSGTLTNVDPDSSGTRCSAANYTTTKKYYDENDDSTEQKSESDVYAVATDMNGCFAVKARIGTISIYG